jgi:hypothetical protein
VRLRPGKTRRRAFIDLTPLDLAAESPGEAPVFLNRFDTAALRRELTEAGVLEGLAARGYGDVDLRIQVEEGEHRLVVVPRGGRTTLIDLRLAEATLLLRALEPAATDAGVLSVLSIHWLSMQDPRGSFTPERPRLPGQRYPGLGLTRELIQRIHQWAAAWGKDALVNFPEYFHNAIFYSAAYRFASPVREGRFQALRRDLASLSVAVASRAVDAGRVVDAGTGRAFAWETGEMLSPLTERAHDCVESERYTSAVQEAREQVRFRLATGAGGRRRA